MTQSPNYDIPAYLERDGAIAILVRLESAESLINKEIENQVHVTTTTLARRLKEGIENDLIEITYDPEDHGNAKRYQLTERGRKLTSYMSARGIDMMYEKFFELHQDLKEEQQVLQEWVSEKGLNEPEWRPRDSVEFDRERR